MNTCLRTHLAKQSDLQAAAKLILAQISIPFDNQKKLASSNAGNSIESHRIMLILLLIFLFFPVEAKLRLEGFT